MRATSSARSACLIAGLLRRLGSTPRPRDGHEPRPVPGRDQEQRPAAFQCHRNYGRTAAQGLTGPYLAPSARSSPAILQTAMPCQVCGHPLPKDARFCPNCGAVAATLLETEERKMVTVLFADLVDSTGLAQALDPQRAREVMSGFFEAATEELQALRGRPEKFIGDAVMAVFGLPHVHEDDALRAVRAGMAIRDRVRRFGRSAGLSETLEVRIGLE